MDPKTAVLISIAVVFLGLGSIATSFSAIKLKSRVSKLETSVVILINHTHATPPAPW